MSKSVKFIAGAVLGALTGSIVVVLLAPGSGDDTKIALSEKLQYIRKQIQDAVAERRSELETELENYKRAN